MGGVEALLVALHDRLAITQPVQPADLIFVLAGRPERKRYGWELFRCRLAPVLLLSVGRSEARFLKARTGLPDDGDIVDLLPIRPQQGNHIFLWAEKGVVRPEVVCLPERNTFGEVWAFSNLVRRRGLRHVLVVSTDVHLRRIRYAMRKTLRSMPPRITYLGVPWAASTCRRGHKWSCGCDAWLVLTEWIKLLGYHVKYGAFHRHWSYASSQ